MQQILFFEKSPLDELENEEYNDLVIKFCSYVCQIYDKKMNFPSIFVKIIEKPEIFEAYVEFCGFDSPKEAVLQFLKFDESIIKSKFLKKIINQNGRRRSKHLQHLSKSFS